MHVPDNICWIIGTSNTDFKNSDINLKDKQSIFMSSLMQVWESITVKPLLSGQLLSGQLLSGQPLYIKRQPIKRPTPIKRPAIKVPISV